MSLRSTCSSVDHFFFFILFYTNVMKQDKMRQPFRTTPKVFRKHGAKDACKQRELYLCTKWVTFYLGRRNSSNRIVIILFIFSNIYSFNIIESYEFSVVFFKICWWRCLCLKFLLTNILQLDLYIYLAEQVQDISP